MVHLYYLDLESILKKVFEYLNCQLPEIKFIFEVKENDKILFLDTKITKENSFSSLSYWKPTFGVLYFNFESFVYLSLKSNQLQTLLFRSF